MIVILMELINAISLEGYLEKQSPGVVKIYQKRYFAVRNNGQFLVWFGKKPNSIDVEPKGIIVIIRIEEIKPADFEDRVFTFNYNSRWFILRAESKEGRDRWLRAITTITDHLKKTLKSKLTEIKSKPTDWKFQNASEEVVKSIRMENEKLLIRDGEGSLYEKSGKQLLNVIGINAPSDIEKCVVFGFLNRKAFIGGDQKWYLMFSEYNLNDERDDNFNERILAYFKNLQHQLPKKKERRESSSSEDLSEGEKEAEIDKSLQINHLYQYDLKSNLTQRINLIDVVSFTKETTQSPYTLKITYNIYEEKEEIEDVTKEIVLQSEYMIEIEKWFKALQIVYQRYSIQKTREAILEKRFMKFEVKMMKINDETEWRMLGTANKAESVLINWDTVKVSGHSYPIADISGEIITSKLSILFKENPNDEGKNKDAYILSIHFKNKDRLELAFEAKETPKQLKKRLKKCMKKLWQQMERRQVKLTVQKQENNDDTYLIDKKIRETSGSIRINFYEMMEREVPTAKQEKQEKQSSFFDRFLQMFCGPPKEEDYLYS